MTIMSPPNRYRRRARGLAVLALAIPFAMGAHRVHITPTVVLHKQADVVRSTLPDAASYFVRTVRLGKEDLDRIRQRISFDIDDPEIRFYSGKDRHGAVVGVVVFAQENTQHGPFEVGVTVGADGTVTHAVATKATVESKPWVERVVDRNPRLMERFVRMTPGTDPSAVVGQLSRPELGAMPFYTAEILTRAVHQALVLYDVLYQTE